MKKLLLPYLMAALTFVSCHKEELETQGEEMTNYPCGASMRFYGSIGIAIEK